MLCSSDGSLALITAALIDSMRQALHHYISAGKEGLLVSVNKHTVYFK